MSTAQKKHDKRQDKNTDAAASEYADTLIGVQRTATVVKGGRIFGFAALVVVGNGKGKVGIGRGKAREVPDAIRKASEAARRNLVTVQLKDGTVHHTIEAEHGASKVFIKPAVEGTGVIAGGAMRSIFEAAGVKNILAKCYGSTNPVNIARATIKALTSVHTPEYIAEKRGLSVEQVTGGNHA